MEETKNFTSAYFVLVGPNTPYQQKQEENSILCESQEKYDKAIEDIKKFLENNEKVHVILNTHGSKGEVFFGKWVRPEEEFKKLDPEGKKQVTISVFACEAGKDIKEDQNISSRTKNLKLSNSHNLVIYAGGKATFMVEGDMMIGRLISSEMAILPILYLDDDDIYFTPPETIKAAIGKGNANESRIKEFSPFKQFKEAISADKILSKEEIVKNITKQQQEILEFCAEEDVITKEGKEQLEKIKNIQSNLNPSSYQPMIDAYLTALLSLSASRDKSQYIEYLVNNKIVDINTKFLESTAIGTAIKSENLNSVKTLLDLGADINIKYQKDITLFALACRVGNNQIVQLLFDKRKDEIDINAINNSDETPLLLAIKAIGNKNNSLERKFAYQEIAKFLINQDKVDLNKASKQGITPLKQALDNNYWEIVELLLKRGADVSNFYDKLRERYGNAFPDISCHKFEFLRSDKDEDFFCKESDKNFPLLKNEKTNGLFEQYYYALKIAYHLGKAEENISVKFDNFTREIIKKYKLRESDLIGDFEIVAEKIIKSLELKNQKEKFLFYCDEKGDESMVSQIENLIKKPDFSNLNNYPSQEKYEALLNIKEKITLKPPKEKEDKGQKPIILKTPQIAEKKVPSEISLKPPNNSPKIQEELKVKLKGNQKTK